MRQVRSGSGQALVQGAALLVQVLKVLIKDALETPSLERGRLREGELRQFARLVEAIWLLLGPDLQG